MLFGPRENTAGRLSRLEDRFRAVSPRWGMELLYINVPATSQEHEKCDWRRKCETTW